MDAKKDKINRKLTKYSKVDKIKFGIIAASVVIFMISLTQNALTYIKSYYVGDQIFYQDHHLHSFELLIVGSTAILGGGLLEWFVWWANPLYFYGLILFHKSNEKSKIISLTAFIISLSFSMWEQITVYDSGQRTIKALNAGYWLWVTAMAVSFVGIIYYYHNIEKKSKVQQQTENPTFPSS